MCIMFLQNAGSVSKGFCKTRLRSRRSSDMAEQQGWGYFRAGEMAVKACVVWSLRLIFHLSALFVICLLPTVPRAPTANLRRRRRLRLQPQSPDAKPESPKP